MYDIDSAVAQEQEFVCGTSPEGLGRIYSPTELSNAKFEANEQKYVFNVFVHYIKNNVPVAEQEIRAIDMVGVLNYAFNPGNIYFKYMGYNNIDNASYLNITYANYHSLCTTYGSTEQIDIFVGNSLPDASAAGQLLSYLGVVNGQQQGSKDIGIQVNSTAIFQTTPPNANPFYANRNGTVCHEMGHYFGLHHTFQEWRYNTQNVLYPVNTTYDYPDCLNIEENLDGSEWYFLGDLIQDTNPDRGSGDEYGLSPLINSSTGNCSIYTNGYHNNGCGSSINLSIYNPPLGNVMSYYPKHCGIPFTQGQLDYMRAYIAENSQPGYFLQNQFNTIESLYESYAEVISGGSSNGGTTTASSKTYTPNENNTGMNVWNCPTHTFKFQKGFSYEFQKGYSTIYKQPHELPAYASGFDVKIPLLGPDAVQYPEILCFGTFEPFVTGSVLSTPNIGSPTTNVKNLNETEASDPQLMETLGNHQYHIITKKTETGISNQKIIYKNQ